MLPPLLDKTADGSVASARDRWLWAFIGFLVVGQIVAFWMLCASQVHKAEIRHAGLQVGRSALADCMQYIPKATLGSCNARVSPASFADVHPASMNTAVAVGNSTIR